MTFGSPWAMRFGVYVQPHRGHTCLVLTILLIVLILVLLFGGGGSYYYRGRRRRGL
jgi:hypothetical protein